MGIPGRADQAGSNTVKRVFKVTFTRPLSSKVKYEAYDNTKGKANFPTLDSVLTTANDIFGMGGGEDSMIGLHDTTATRPQATSWFPDTPNANTSSINLLKGTTTFVTQHGATVSAGGSITYSMQCKIVASMQTSSITGFDLAFRYTYTSTQPTLAFFFMDATLQDWTALTPGTHGIVHTRAGTVTLGPYLANIPVTGQEKTAEAWVVASLT